VALQLQLVQTRASQAQQAGDERAVQQKIASLEADLKDKDRQIGDLRAQIARGQPQVASADAGPAGNTVASGVSFRMGQAVAPSSNPAALIQMVRSLGPANYHALVIGIGNYRYMQKLKTPLSDAQDVARLLEGRYGFHVKLLLDATRDQIIVALHEYTHTLTDQDRLLIYFAGHGSTRDFPPERAFWAGVDTDPDLLSSWLPAQPIADEIWQMHARHVLLVADSCFSSVITHATSTIVARTSNEQRIRIQWTRGARMVMTSGQDQPVVDSPSADSLHSLFADTFLTVLRQNDVLLSGEMLAHEIRDRLAASSARLGLKQTPTYTSLQDPQHQFGDFFFVPVAPPVRVAALTP